MQLLSGNIPTVKTETADVHSLLRARSMTMGTPQRKWPPSPTPPSNPPQSSTCSPESRHRRYLGRDVRDGGDRGCRELRRQR
jgi:hypothetical protein